MANSDDDVLDLTEVEAFIMRQAETFGFDLTEEQVKQTARNWGGVQPHQADFLRTRMLYAGLVLLQESVIGQSDLVDLLEDLRGRVDKLEASVADLAAAWSDGPPPNEPLPPEPAPKPTSSETPQPRQDKDES